MKTELYYFTGTGNGLHVAKTIRRELEEAGKAVVLTPINQVNLGTSVSSQADQVGIIFPTYAMTAPAIVKRLANQLTLQPGAQLFLYGHSGGGGAGRAINALVSIFAKRNMTISHTYETVFPSNSAVRGYTPDQVKEVLAKSEVSIKEHAKSIRKEEVRPVPAPGFVKETTRKMTESLANFAEGLMGFKEISANEACVGCGLCEKVCPQANIQMEKGGPAFDTNCEMCAGCFNACPHKALKYKKMNEKNLISYRHPQVDLKELIRQQ